MFENLFADASTIGRHRNGPLVDERHRYLLHCASVGATLHTQRNRARALLWISEVLAARDHGRIGVERLRQLIATRRPPVARRTAANLFNIARPWLKFIGWWDQPREVTLPSPRRWTASLPGCATSVPDANCCPLPAETPRTLR